MKDPALVYEASVSGTPGTHAVVVGIGAYDHLDGGSEVEFTRRLGQLRSPVPSARAMADWFLTSFSNPAKPLHSLSVVLSEAAAAVYPNPHSGESAEVPAGTGDDVALAIQAWAARASSHPDNLSVFFFCGHGLSVGKTNSLLARDFGGNRFNHDAGVIDAVAVVDGMKAIGPSEQVFLFDACRNTDEELLDSTGRRPLSPRPGVAITLPMQAVLYSALADTRAYGRPDQPSVFTEHLLVGLRSAAKPDETEQWWVETSLLRTQIDKRSRSIQIGDSSGQEVKLHMLPGEPLFPVKITCDPADGIHGSLLTCTCLNRNHVCAYDGSYQLDEDAWEAFLAPDRYNFSAAPNGHHGFEMTECDRLVYPPHVEVRLKLTAKTGKLGTP